jgi:Protein of unknown function (DUF3592)
MIYGLMTLAFGALALWAGRRMHKDIVRGRAWPTTDGRILERGVGAPMAAQSRSYLPRVRYSYTVGERDFVNDQVYLHRQSGGWASKVQLLVDGLPDLVPVHFDPQDPARSFLLVNPLGTVWLLLVFGIGATVMGLLQVLVALG